MRIDKREIVICLFYNNEKEEKTVLLVEPI